jgi:hypothetical protein
MKCVRGGFPVRNPEDAGLSDSGIGDLHLEMPYPEKLYSQVLPQRGIHNE